MISENALPEFVVSDLAKAYFADCENGQQDFDESLIKTEIVDAVTHIKMENE